MAVTPYKYNVALISNNVGYTAGDSMTLVKFGNKIYRGPSWPSSETGIWVSDDNGATFTQLSDFPGAARHWYGFVVIGSYMYLFCGQGATDLWRFDGTTWLQITLTGDTMNQMYIPCTCTDGIDMFIGGGQSSYSGGATPYQAFYKITTSGVVTFLSNLPANCTSGCGIWYLNGNIVIGGGGLSDPHSTNDNNKIYRSTDKGLTWTEIATVIPALMGYYTTSGVWDNKLWWMGYNNQNGLYYSGDGGVNWLRCYLSPPGNHASWIGEILNGECGMFLGHDGIDSNLVLNSFYKLKKVSF